MNLGKVTAPKETLEALGLDNSDDDEKLKGLQKELSRRFDAAWNHSLSRNLSMKIQKHSVEEFYDDPPFAVVFGLIQAAHGRLAGTLFQDDVTPKLASTMAGELLNMMTQGFLARLGEADGDVNNGSFQKLDRNEKEWRQCS